MKIGELARLCNVSVATIRYYVSIGMLVPDNRGAQYDFSDREYRELQIILKMRRQRFNLKEIENYLLLVRHSNLIEPDTIEVGRKMLQDKQQELQLEINQLKQFVREIGEEISQLDLVKEPPKRIRGLPLSALNLLVCPHCGRPLQIEKAVIQNGTEIISGELNCPAFDFCSSHYRAVIENGIVKTGNVYTENDDMPDSKRGLYRDMVPEFSVAIQHCCDRISDNLFGRNCELLNHKVILEANLNGFFYLYHYIHELPPDCTLILTDKYEEILERYKTYIEQMEVDVPVLYIADAGVDYPIRMRSVDVYISFFGENEHQLYHHDSYLKTFQRYFDQKARVYGALISFDEKSESRKKLHKKYPHSGPLCYQMDLLKREYVLEGWNIFAKEIGKVMDSGHRKYSFECHVKGEPLRVYYFEARREGEGTN